MSIGGGSKKAGPSEQERGLAERGAMDFNTAMETVLPATSALKKRLTETGAKAERAGSEASLAAATATGTGSDGRVGESKSGRVVAGQGDLVDAASASVGAGTAAAGQQLDNQEVTGGLRLAKAGRGIAAEGTRMLGDVARQKTNEELAKQKSDIARSESLLATASTVAGAAAAKDWKTPDPTSRSSGWKPPDDGFRGVYNG